MQRPQLIVKNNFNRLKFLNFRSPITNGSILKISTEKNSVK